MLKNLLANAGDASLIPGLGRSPMPQATKPVCHNYCVHTLQQRPRAAKNKQTLKKIFYVTEKCKFLDCPNLLSLWGSSSTTCFNNLSGWLWSWRKLENHQIRPNNTEKTSTHLWVPELKPYPLGLLSRSWAFMNLTQRSWPYFKIIHKKDAIVRIMPPTQICPHPRSLWTCHLTWQEVVCGCD